MIILCAVVSLCCSDERSIFQGCRSCCFNIQTKVSSPWGAYIFFGWDIIEFRFLSSSFHCAICNVGRAMCVSCHGFSLSFPPKQSGSTGLPGPKVLLGGPIVRLVPISHIFAPACPGKCPEFGVAFVGFAEGVCLI